MDMDRRKEELEKKRQKLAELRRAREERKQVFSHATTETTKEKPVRVYSLIFNFLVQI